jgi:hypothetical protein
MRLLIFIVIAVAGGLITMFVRRNADARESNVMRELDRMQARPTHCEPELVTAVKDNVRYMASMVRSLVIFTVLAVLAAFGCLAWLQDISDSQRVELSRSCTADREFRRLFEQQLTEDLRVARDRRNDLADDIATEETDISSLPEFADLPGTVQRFLGGLLAAQVQEANARLEEMDVEIEQLVVQVDQVRAFNLDSDCPSP